MSDGQIAFGGLHLTLYNFAKEARGRPWLDLLGLPTRGQDDLLPRPRSPCLVPSVSTVQTTGGARDLLSSMYKRTDGCNMGVSTGTDF